MKQLASINPFAEEGGLPIVQEQAAICSHDDAFALLKGWQRQAMNARLILITAVGKKSEEMGVSVKAMIDELLIRAQLGQLPAHLVRAIKEANVRKGVERTLTRPTVYRWFKIYKDDGLIGLAPKERDDSADSVPLWLEDVLAAYRQPTKPKLRAVLRDMGPAAPPYHQVVRALKRFSNVDIHKGRMSGSELRALKAYTKRDFSGLSPMDVIVADGHSFKSYVAHPVHGKRFLPEVETVIDVATRVCVGWSAGLSESGQIVADAIRHAATIHDKKPMGGIFAILYADNGAGNRAKMNSDEVTGIVARIGGSMKFGIAGNPQGQGVIERLNQSLWIPAAKKLITYNGKDMDALAQRKRLKLVDKDLKDKGVSPYLITWPQFLDFLSAEVEMYNNRPHSSLPKITDASGIRRHMTPAERWQSFAAEGWRPDTLTPEEMRDLFRPQVEVTTYRGLVRVFSNEYFNAELEHHHGEKVYVNYDIHDPEIVWVRDLKQRLICEAQWNGNRRAFYPVSVVEQAREQRMERRISLKREQIREIEAEARGAWDADVSIPDECVTISSPPVSGGVAEGRGGSGDFDSFIEDQKDSGQAGMTESGNDEPSPNPDVTKLEAAALPMFESSIERFEWHLKNGIHTDEHQAWCDWFRTTNEFKLLFPSETQNREEVRS